MSKYNEFNELSARIALHDCSDEDIERCDELAEELDIADERDDGWTVGTDGHPYTFEEVDTKPERGLMRVETVVPLTENPHKNTHFLYPHQFYEFLVGYEQITEYIISVEQTTIDEAVDELTQQKYTNQL
jgi:hypothetical protein